MLIFNYNIINNLRLLHNGRTTNEHTGIEKS